MSTKYILPEFFQRFVWVPLRILMIGFCSLKITGIENIKNVKGNMIIASNHLSELDPLLIVSVLPFFSRKLPLIYVSRQKNLYSGADWSKWKQIAYGGTFFKMIGAYPSYKGLNNYKLALPHHLEVIKKGGNVAIFPYGGIVRGIEKPKARGGVSFLAHETKLPIIPLKISGTETFTPQNLFSRKNKFTFTFGKPIYAKDIFKNKNRIILDKNRNDYEAAAGIVMKRVEELS